MLWFLFVASLAVNTPPPSLAQRPIQIGTFEYTNQDQYANPEAKSNHFDWELLKYLKINDNVLVSPASIKSTLAMVLEGAGGNTAQEITNALELPADENKRRQLLQQLINSLSDTSESTTLKCSNAVYVSTNYQIVPDYQTKLGYYKAALEPLNFHNSNQAADTINAHVRGATNGLIPEIVTPSQLDPDTAVVITNALYFKSVWKNEFDESSTRPKRFCTQTRQCIHTLMMQMVAIVNYKQLNFGHAVELPYGDNKYAMLILLPNEKDNFRQFMNIVQSSSFAGILNKLEPTEIMLELPRFEINYSTDLVETLKRINIRDAFDANANLSGIVYNKNVGISSVIHKTKIEVNEKGTEAAAATGVMVTPLMGSSMPRIIADHPFVFFIYNVHTRDILFEGILNEPKEVLNVATRTTADFTPLTNRNSFSTPILNTDPLRSPQTKTFTYNRFK